ncbi:S8 family serine peptidase [Silanimonas lenta]|uniref:S8 family serine peptidase n=1 Tax=Silanimonas lenta TaxID=265429 RepID=UPI000407E0AF|nr:S8 family serine peptidase [Silanimonas lenta]
MRYLALAAAIALALPPAVSVDARGPGLPAEAMARADSRSTYLVSFVEPAAPQFRGFQAKDGKRPALAPVSIAVTGQPKYDPARPEAQAYLDYLGDLREQRLAAASSLLGRPLEPLFVYEHALNGVALELTAGEAQRLAGLPGVRAVTPDFERFALTDRGPAWIKAPDLWSGAAGVTSRGESIVVGVIDSGVNATHPSFAAVSGSFTHSNPKGRFFGWCVANPASCNTKLIGLYDFVAGGSNGTGASGADPDGHGTHVASTAVGNPVNSTFSGQPVTISGVAPRANLISYRGCGSTPDNRSCGSGARLVASINQAIADGVDVINYSIGGSAYDPWLTVGGAINSDTEAFLAAREAGIVVAAAAGNEGPNPGTLGSPANSPWVLGVASVTHNRSGQGDVLASSSGRGPVVPRNVIKPDVAAPGVQIRAASNTDNGVRQMSGTSMASPHVAGAAALLKAARPGWNADQIISALMLTARPDTVVDANFTPSNPHQRGAGTLDLSLAVNASLALRHAADAFRNANAGNASALNLPSLAAENCVDSCTLTRSFSAMPGTSGGTYQVIVNMPADVVTTGTPSSLVVPAGGAGANIGFRFAAASNATLNEWKYGSVTLRRSGGGTPDLRLPVAIYLSSGTVPPLQERNVSGERGYVDFELGGIISLPNARFGSTELAAPEVREQALAQDSNRTSPYDNLSDGVTFLTRTVNFNDGQTRTVTVQGFLRPAATPGAQDLDLFMGIDANGNGQPDEAEEQCESISPGAVESCTLTFTHFGNNVPVRVWALAQNYQASAAGASDPVRLELVAIDSRPSARQKATGPGNVPSNTAFKARLVYDDPGFLPGQSRYGFLLVDRGPGQNAIRVPFKLNRTSSTPAPFALSAGVDRNVVLPANAAHEYLFIDVPAGATQLVATTSSAANVDLYLARTPAPVPSEELPSIAAAPARGSANASATTPGGNETITVNNPAPGRWYITPVNTTGSPAEVVVRASVSGTAPSIRPGGYFNPGRSGHGLFLFPAPPVLAGVWYAYEEDGSPTWYYIQADAPGANGIWPGVLYRSAWNGSANVLVEVGTLIVTPTATDEFTFTYNLDGQTGSEAFRSMGGGCPSFAGAPLNVSSHWFNPARSGSGYSVLMYPNYEFIASFVYDGLGRPRFLLMERNSFGGATASGALEQLTGFCPLCPRSGNPSRTPIGTLSRSFANGTFTNITLNGTYVNGVPGSWSANESVRLLDPNASPSSLRGCP